MDEILDMPLHLRKPELTALALLFYLAALGPLLPGRPRADGRVLLLAFGVTVGLLMLAWAEARLHPLAFSIARDWIALGLVLTCYRTLDWFSPVRYAGSLELSWVRLDQIVLINWGLRAAIESSGKLFPFYLELCYLLTSAAGAAGLAVLYLNRKRDRCDTFLFVYLLGTLAAYAIIPFFPSQPPRIAFPFAQAPTVATAIRTVNLSLLGKAGIHSGVFPSAHVSSTFAAAWGMWLAIPERRVYGWLFLVYAASVALATVYGRYHYAVDAVAGIAVSLIPVAVCLLCRRFRSTPVPASRIVTLGNNGHIETKIGD
jgi:membrane-associated phospholipid phosphatase